VEKSPVTRITALKRYVHNDTSRISKNLTARLEEGSDTLAMPALLPNQVMEKLRQSECLAHRSQKIGLAP
jgi:hypothetical protein